MIRLGGGLSAMLIVVFAFAAPAAAELPAAIFTPGAEVSYVMIKFDAARREVPIAGGQHVTLKVTGEPLVLAETKSLKARLEVKIDGRPSAWSDLGYTRDKLELMCAFWNAAGPRLGICDGPLPPEGTSTRLPSGEINVSWGNGSRLKYKVGGGLTLVCDVGWGGVCLKQVAKGGKGSLLSRLRAGAGGEAVLLLSGDWGIFASRGDGSAWKETVVVPRADAAVLDGTHDLVWYTQRGGLWVADLRTEESKPVKILDGVPAGAGFRVTGIGELQSPGAGHAVNLVVLSWGPTPSVTRGPKGVKLVGAAWLRDHTARPRRKIDTTVTAIDPRSKVSVPKDLARCDDGVKCGQSAPLVQELRLVVVEHACTGEVCKLGCVIHDKKRGAFASPLDTSVWGQKVAAGPCGAYRFHDGGERFLLEGSVCKLGVKCREAGGTALGWLDPGPTIGDERRP